MAFQTQNNSSPTTLSEINITPLVDVMLVLLIIFMVTAPLMMEGVKVDLPSASTQALKTEKDDQIVLSINKTGELFFSRIKAVIPCTIIAKACIDF